jgi:hypothetical protein
MIFNLRILFLYSLSEGGGYVEKYNSGEECVVHEVEDIL